MKSKARTLPFSVVSNGVWFITLLAILFVSVNPVIADVPKQDEYPPFIPDGKWVGAFSGVDSILVEGGTASASYKGTLSFEVLAGEVAGDFKASGNSESLTSQAYGYAEFNASGVVQGTAQEPEIHPTQTTMNFEIYPSGVTTPFTFSSSGAGSGSLAMTLQTKFSCSEVHGDLNISTVVYLEEKNALPMDVNTEFNAVRVGGIYSDDPEAYQTKLSDLQDALVDFMVETYKNQSVDGDKLFDLVSKSMGLTLGIISDNSCDLNNGIDRKWFHTQISKYVGKLIDMAYDHPDWFSEYQLEQIAYAGFDAGTFGSGAIDPDKATKFEAEVQKVALDKLKALDHPDPNCDALYALALVGDMLPNPVVYNTAYDLMGKYQCSGSI